MICAGKCHKQEGDQAIRRTGFWLRYLKQHFVLVYERSISIIIIQLLKTTNLSLIEW